MKPIKRRVFYIGGFDPRGVRFYRELMRGGIARFGSRAGEATTMRSAPATNPLGADWIIANADQAVATRYTFLRWEDLVRRAWIRNPFTLARRAARTYWRHWRHLDRAMLARLPRGPIVTLVYPPVATLLLPVLLALPLLLLAGFALPGYLALPLALLGGTAAALPLLHRFHAPWLLRFFVFNSELAEAPDAALEARLDGFADAIAEALDSGEGPEETLLITHSNGSILAVMVMARLLARYGGAMPDRFALITYGQCIPLLACRRDATGFHEQLRMLARSRFRWIDIGSPPDGAAFHAVNPLAFHAETWVPALSQLSPRFHRFYDAESYHKGWHNKYEIHFDYLRVGDRISPLDLPTLIASRRTIDQAVETFRGIA